MTNKLKNCPFCNSNASLVLCNEVDDYGNKNKFGFVVQCNNKDCGCSLNGSIECSENYDDNTSDKLKQKAIEKWNTRVDENNKDKITYIPYAIDRGWFKQVKSMIDNNEIEPKYVWEEILSDLILYKEEIKHNEKLKCVLIEEIGDISIFIEKVKEKIKKYDKERICN